MTRWGIVLVRMTIRRRGRNEKMAETNCQMGTSDLSSGEENI
jgi:hypothetical protein